MSLIPTESTIENTESEETTEKTTEVTETTEPAITEDNKPTFLFADGIAGEGDAPEWFKADKYKTVSDQAKAYVELESKFGSFKGSPKEGKYQVEGFDFEDNPLIGAVAEWGLENQLSNEGMKTLATKVHELAIKQQEEDRVAAMTQLGSNAQQRINTLAQWGKNNLSAEEFTSFQGLAQTAGHVEVLEKLIGMTKNSKLAATKQTSTTSTSTSEAELKKMYLATDPTTGKRLMETDRAYRDKVNKAYKEFYEN